MPALALLSDRELLDRTDHDAEAFAVFYLAVRMSCSEAVVRKRVSRGLLSLRTQLREPR
jgi:DNA-directed RNA polymerase specialized sigma24 family protein